MDSTWIYNEEILINAMTGVSFEVAEAYGEYESAVAQCIPMTEEVRHINWIFQGTRRECECRIRDMARTFDAPTWPAYGTKAEPKAQPESLYDSADYSDLPF